MIITIYDFDDEATNIEIPAKSVDEINLISVNVKSGDETGFVALKNGDVIHFDASDCRIHGFDDGSYILNTAESIKKWLEYKPSGETTASYERQAMFY